MLQKILKFLSLAVYFVMDSTKDTGKIVVFKKYESVIQANVAKTKLDAYGVPCFLTNEHISSLYPLPYMNGMEVGLFIFKEDESRVKELLSDDDVNTDTEKFYIAK